MYTWSILSCVNVRLRVRARFPACQVQPCPHLWGGEGCAEHPGTRVSSCLLGTITALIRPALVQLSPAAKNENPDALSCRLAPTELC